MTTLASGGLEFAVAILLGVFGGQWLDHRWHTSPWLLVVGTFAGAAAGFYNLYRAIASSTTDRRGGASRAAAAPAREPRDGAP